MHCPRCCPYYNKPTPLIAMALLDPRSLVCFPILLPSTLNALCLLYDFEQISFYLWSSIWMHPQVYPHLCLRCLCPQSTVHLVVLVNSRKCDHICGSTDRDVCPEPFLRGLREGSLWGIHTLIHIYIHINVMPVLYRNQYIVHLICLRHMLIQ